MTIAKKPMHHGSEWQLQEAKNRLSRVVEEARRGQPQTITLRGIPAAVVVSFEQYQALTRPPSSLAAFLGASPLAGLELDLERSRDAGREIEL